MTRLQRKAPRAVRQTDLMGSLTRAADKVGSCACLSAAAAFDPAGCRRSRTRSMGDGGRRRDFGLSSAAHGLMRRRSRGTRAVLRERRRGGWRGRHSLRHRGNRLGQGFRWRRRASRKAGEGGAFALDIRSVGKVGGGRSEWRVGREGAARRRPGAGGSAKVEGAFANQPPDIRLGAAGDGCAAALRFRGFCRRQSRRGQIIRSLRQFVHHCSRPQSKWQ